MYAVIETGSKQYSVREGDHIDVELLHAEAGSKVRFDDVRLLVNGEKIHVGKPSLSGAVVEGEIVGNVAGEKLVSMKYKRRKGVRCKRGHRQHYQRVKITNISA